MATMSLPPIQRSPTVDFGGCSAVVDPISLRCSTSFHDFRLQSSSLEFCSSPGQAPSPSNILSPGGLARLGLAPLFLCDDLRSPLSTPAVESTRALLQKEAVQKAARFYRERLRMQMAKLCARPTGSAVGSSVVPIRVVGRPLTPTDWFFYERIQCAIADAENPAFPEFLRSALKITNIRGAYFISEINPEKRHLLASVVEADIPKLGIRPIAVFKPADEVRGAGNHIGSNPAKFGIAPKWEIPNEVIAAGLYPDCCGGMEVVLTSKSFVVLDTKKVRQFDVSSMKSGFLMPYMQGAKDLKMLIETDGDYESVIAKMPRERFERLAIFDLSKCNIDRNEGNLLVLPDGCIVPIDQALILPSRFQSPALFAWMDWEHAQAPFSPAAQAAVHALSFEEDAAKIRAAYPIYSARNLETMRIAYYLLKKGVSAGLTPFQIGCFLTGNPSSCTASPLGAIYKLARASADQDPDAVFAKVATTLDKAILFLKEQFEAMLKETKATATDENQDQFTKNLKDCVEARLIGFSRVIC